MRNIITIATIVAMTALSACSNDKDRFVGTWKPLQKYHMQTKDTVTITRDGDTYIVTTGESKANGEAPMVYTYDKTLDAISIKAGDVIVDAHYDPKTGHLISAPRVPVRGMAMQSFEMEKIR
jgi:hypothetical protein